MVIRFFIIHFPQSGLWGHIQSDGVVAESRCARAGARLTRIVPRLAALEHIFQLKLEYLARTIVRHRLEENYFLGNFERRQASAAMGHDLLSGYASITDWHDKGCYRLP